MTPTPQDPKARVREKYPKAFATKGYSSLGWFIWKRHVTHEFLGYGPTEAEAWADAAKRLEGE